jgi:hypothetical protein
VNGLTGTAHGCEQLAYPVEPSVEGRDEVGPATPFDDRPAPDTTGHNEDLPLTVFLLVWRSRIRALEGTVNPSIDVDG